jgi:hypothetical protein
VRSFFSRELGIPGQSDSESETCEWSNAIGSNWKVGSVMRSPGVSMGGGIKSDTSTMWSRVGFWPLSHGDYGGGHRGYGPPHQPYITMEAKPQSCGFANTFSAWSSGHSAGITKRRRRKRKNSSQSSLRIGSDRSPVILKNTVEGDSQPSGAVVLCIIELDIVGRQTAIWVCSPYHGSGSIENHCIKRPLFGVNA